MSTLVTILHVICSLFLMLTVLLQSGKGGGMGAAFGGGTSATVFGGSGASTFLKKLTAGAATVFMLTSMTLAYIASSDAGDSLEDFSSEQQSLAKQKAEVRRKALEESGGSGSAGSGSGVVTPGSGVTPGSAVTPDPSSDSMSPIPPLDDGDREDGDVPAENPADPGTSS